MVAHDGDGGCLWWFLCISPLQSIIDFFFLSSLFLSQLFVVGLNWWLLGLKWWVVSVVAMVEIGLWVTVEIGFLGFNWCFGGDLLRWVAVVALGLCFGGVVAALGGAGFVFRWCFVVVVLWRHWVCCGGVVLVCNGNTQH